ncbi:protein ECERIFERUM 26-like [Panicum hallii]|nr:protein ECERIFERUM 26-like [Panicum hallii]
MMVAELAAAGSGSPLAAGAGAGDMTVHSYRLSTVVPGSVTGEAVDYELADADLLHKLHYLRAVHVFRAPAPGDAAALAVRELKEPMFPWLDMYFPVSGRLRRRDGEAAPGRPYVRCNDCGVRIVEAAVDATVEEWLEQEAERGGLCKPLAYDKVIGPELFFSPLLYVQITSFKCGGMALGFTWAHLIGDIPSAAACFSTWAQLLSGKKAPAPTLRDPHTKPLSAAPAGVTAPPSVKATAAPVGDDWRVPTACEMVPFSFHVTEQQLKRLLLGSHHHQVSTFELVAALVWRAVAAIRGPEEEEETRTVTVVKTTDPAAAPSGGRRLGLTNEHRIGHVVAPAGLPPAAADVAELAALLAGASLDGAGAVAALAGADDADAVVYGANLTLVDAEGLDVYGGLELGARRPAHVEYAVDGAGDGGAVVVHRDAGGRGRTVAAAVRRGEAGRLRAALRDALRVA